MVTVYSAPDHITRPNLDARYPEYDNLCKDYIAKVRSWVMKRAGKRKNAGKIVYVGHADGYAMYMIFSWNPLQVIHLPIGDAWDSPYIRNFTKEDMELHIKTGGW